MGAATAPPREEVAPAKAKGKSTGADEIHWQGGVDPRTLASQGTVPVAAPTIDEMLELMSRQIMQVITWTQADGFVDSYRSASPNARGLFHAAVIKLAARADQMRRS